MSDNKVHNTSIRIDFVVREVCHDGSVDSDDLRFIRFGEEVTPSGVPDFFQRVGQAMTLMFRQSLGMQALSFVNVGSNKISVIKVVRELGGYGLKEAKDLVEAACGTTFLIVEPNDLNHCIQKLSEAGAKVEARSGRTQEIEGGAQFQPPFGSTYAIQRFVRRP